MSDLMIRPLTATDETDWRRLWTAYLAFYNTVLPEETFVTTFSRMLSGKDNEFHGLLAVLDGKPVGLTHYLFHRSGWFTDNICYLQDLYADPAVRGKGIGRALIEAVYERASAAKAPKVYWMTQENNATARQLYDRIAVKSPFLVYQKVF